MKVSRALTYVWGTPTTLLGFAAALLSLSRPRPEQGVLVCISDRGFARHFLTRRGYCAITLGYVVLLTPDAPADVMDHERVHIRQAESKKWGPLFLPAYLTAMCVAGIKGLDPYWDNPFEAEARNESTRHG